jgi:hypothetical protein
MTKQRGRQGVPVVLPDVKSGLPKVIGQQPETRDVGRPTPSAGRERQQRHLQNIAAFSAIDKNWPGDRIYSAEVQLADGRGRGSLRKLPAGGLIDLEFNRLPRRDSQRGGKGIVPSIVMLMSMDGVLVRHRYLEVVVGIIVNEARFILIALAHARWQCGTRRAQGAFGGGTCTKAANSRMLCADSCGESAR